MTLAGDADRSRAIVTLRDATVEGRLTLDEFADRVERAELARTDTELAEVVADLPSAGAADLPVKHGAWFSRLTRGGRWELSPQSKVVSVCGTIELDLGHATLHGAETVMHVRNVFGTVTIVVPDAGPSVRMAWSFSIRSMVIGWRSYVFAFGVAYVQVLPSAS